MALLDPAACYRALKTRDRRFDGRFFVGVRTTGVYCRPICPARTPRFENVTFHPSAAAAQEAGFRPCLRCRPEASPDIALWRGTSNTVARALSLIAGGGRDGDETNVDALATRVGVGERQLRRRFRDDGKTTGAGTAHGVTLYVAYRPPYDWNAMLAHLSARAIPGVEHVDDGRYVRTVVEGDEDGTVEVAHVPERHALAVTIRFPNVRAFAAFVGRVKRLFDVSADVEAIGAGLTHDATLASLIARRPGLRVPGAWDGFELAIRAVLGQQVTVSAARRLAGALVEACGALATHGNRAAPSRRFPDPARLLASDLGRLGMPRSRKTTLRAIAEAALRDPRLFAPAASLDDALARLLAIPGIGDWTAQYIALRALRETDAFPATDAGLLRAADALGIASTTGALLARSEAWRPWRAYAAQHLWAADADDGWKEKEVAHG